MKRVRKSRSDRIGSDLKEINIFVGLTLVIFFVAIGFPTLINTSPTLGYEGVEWTPVTSYYQEAYAQQQLMETLAFSNYNPIVLSAFLVMPTSIDNPPPDPMQYFELKYSQLIQIDTGFIPFETIKELFNHELFTAPNLLPEAFATHPTTGDRTYPDPYAYYDFDSININSNGFSWKNLGTAGSVADAYMLNATDEIGGFENTTISVPAGTFNSTGLFGQAVLTNRTTGGDTQSINAKFVQFGNEGDLAQWQFLYENNDDGAGSFGSKGANLTTITFWSHGDITTATNHKMLYSQGTVTNSGGQGAQSYVHVASPTEISMRIDNNPPAGTRYINEGGALIPVDGDWHFYSFRLNKTGTPSAEMCIDSTLCTVGFESSIAFASTIGGLSTRSLLLNPAPDVLASGTSSSSIVDWSVDEFAVWKDYLLTDTEIAFLYNSGAGNKVLLGIGSNVTGLTSTANANKTITVDWDNANSLSTLDLEAYWKFEETSGNMTTEDFVNIPDADSVLDGGITKTNTGIIGNAWRTHPTSDFTNVTIGGTASDWNFVLDDDASYNFWTTQADPVIGSDQGFIFTTINFTATPDIGDSIRLDYGFADDQIIFVNINSTGNNFQELSPVGILDRDCRPTCTAFSMYTITKNITSNEIKWYLNGTLFGTDTFTEQIKSGVDDVEITPTLFTRGVEGLSSLNGATVDEFSVWSRVLSTDEITTLYNDGSGFEITQTENVEPVGYQIFRTSTEQTDITIFQDTTDDGFQTDTICMDSSLDDGDAYCGINTLPSGLEGEWVSEFTIDLIRTSSSLTNGDLKGVILTNATDIGGAGANNATLGISFDTIPVGSIPVFDNDFYLAWFNFRPPIEINATGQGGNGLAVFGENGTVQTGRLDFEIHNSQTDGTRFDAQDGDPTDVDFQQDAGGADNYITIVDQSKINITIATPFVANTSSTQTFYLDEDVEVGQTYFYRVVPIFESGLLGGANLTTNATAIWSSADSTFPAEDDFDTWQIREHSGTGSVFTDFEPSCGFRFDETLNRLRIDELGFAPSAESVLEKGNCLVFKNFNMTEFGGTDFDIRWSGSSGTVTTFKIKVIATDEKYDRTNSTDHFITATAFTNLGTEIATFLQVSSSFTETRSITPDWEDADALNKEFFTLFIYIEDSFTSNLAPKLDLLFINFTNPETGDVVAHWDFESGGMTDYVRANGVQDQEGLYQVNVTQSNAQIQTPILSGAYNEITNDIDISWTVGSGDIDAYRIYRTSTESADLKTIVNGLSATGTREFDSSLPHFAHAQSEFTGNLQGEIIAEATVKTSNNTAGTPASLSGAMEGIVCNDCGNLSSDLTLLADSSNVVMTDELYPSGFKNLNFKFRGSQLINITNGLEAGVGYKRGDDNGFVGELNSAVDNSIIDGIFVEGSTSWNDVGGTTDLGIEVLAINQSKLSNDPLLSDTGSLSVTFTDETPISDNTYLFRVVGINSTTGIEITGLSNIINVTTPLLPNKPFGITLEDTGNSTAIVTFTQPLPTDASEPELVRGNYLLRNGTEYPYTFRNATLYLKVDGATNGLLNWVDHSVTATIDGNGAETETYAHPIFSDVSLDTDRGCLQANPFLCGTLIQEKGGRIFGGFNFDGATAIALSTSDVAPLSSPVATQNTGSMTMWVSLEESDIALDQYLFYWGNNDTTVLADSIALLWNGTEQNLQLRNNPFGSGGSHIKQNTTSTTNIFLNDTGKHHIAVVYDEHSPDAKIYIDGELQDMLETDPSPFLAWVFNLLSPETLWFGAGNDAGTFEDFFTGIMDEMRYYDFPLNSYQVTRLAEQGFDTFGLMQYYQFDSGVLPDCDDRTLYDQRVGIQVVFGDSGTDPSGTTESKWNCYGGTGNTIEVDGLIGKALNTDTGGSIRLGSQDDQTDNTVRDRWWYTFNPAGDETTWNFWINGSDQNTKRELYDGIQGANQNQGWQIFWEDSSTQSKMQIQQKVVGSSIRWTELTADGYLSFDNDYHMYTIVVQHDSSTSGITTWYKDGELFEVDTGTNTCTDMFQTNACTTVSSLRPRVLGGDLGVLDDFSMDEFSLWNRALLSKEIFRLYNNGSGLSLEPSIPALNQTAFIDDHKRLFLNSTNEYQLASVTDAGQADPTPIVAGNVLSVVGGTEQSTGFIGAFNGYGTAKTVDATLPTEDCGVRFPELLPPTVLMTWASVDPVDNARVKAVADTVPPAFCSRMGIDFDIDPLRAIIPDGALITKIELKGTGNATATRDCTLYTLDNRKASSDIGNGTGIATLLNEDLTGGSILTSGDITACSDIGGGSPITTFTFDDVDGGGLVQDFEGTLVDEPTRTWFGFGAVPVPITQGGITDFSVWKAPDMNIFYAQSADAQLPTFDVSITDTISVSDSGASKLTPIVSDLGNFNEEIDIISSIGNTEAFIGQLMNTTGIPIGTTFSVEKVSAIIFNPDLDNFGNITAVILNNVTDGGDVADHVVVATSELANVEDHSNTIGESLITFNFTSPVDITIDGTDFIGFKVENVVNTVSFDVYNRVNMNQTSGTCFVANGTTSTTWGTCADFGLSGQELSMEIAISDTSDELFETTGGIEPDKLVLHYTFDEEQMKDITGIVPTSGFTGLNSSISNTGTLGSDADGTYYFFRALPELESNIIQLNKTGGLLGDSLIKSIDPNKIIVGNTANRANFAFLHDNSSDTWSINFWIKQKAGDFFQDMGIGESRVFLSTKDGNFNNGITLYTEQESLGISLRQWTDATGSDRRLRVGTDISTSTFPADTDWHMVTVIMEKPNATSLALACIDNSCDSLDEFLPNVSTDEVQPTPLFINDDHSNTLQEHTLGSAEYEMDELCIWEDYKLTASDRATLYNSGAGTTCGTVNSVSAGGGGLSLILSSTTNQTIIDTATVSDQVTVNKFIIDITNLEAYWKFDETSGGFKNSNITNIFPDGNSTTETGTFNKTVTGIIGTAWKSPATGVGNNVKIGGTPSDYDFFLTQNSTMNMWIKDESCDDNNEGVLGTQNTAGGIGIVNILNCVPSSSARFTTEFIGTAGTHTGFAGSGSYKAQDSQFHMYTILHDSSDGTPQGMFDFYTDGVFINRNCSFGCNDDLTAGGTFQTPIFWNHPNTNLGMNNATFDEFSFWSRALSADEITSLYNNGFGLELQNQVAVFPINITDTATVSDQVTIILSPPIDTTDLEAYWKFEETSGNMTTENFVNIPDADSSGDADITKTNTGILGNAWRTGSSNGVKVNITGTATDWNFAIQNSSSFNFWITQGDPNQPSSGRFFTTENPIALSNGMRLIFDYDLSRLFYLIQQQGIIKANESSPFGYIDNSCLPTCTAFTMYTITINDTSGEVKWYSNGTLQETDTGATFATLDNSLTPVLFGNPIIDFGNLNLATTDELSVWSKVLTPLEVIQLFNNSNGYAISSSGQTFDETITDTATVSDQVTITKNNRTYPDPFLYMDFDSGSINVDGVTWKNLGTAGSVADGFMTISLDEIGGVANFTISTGAGSLNATGLLGQAVITNGTTDDSDTGDTHVIFGTIANRGQWKFLEENNNNGTVLGSNVTSVSFWSNGDVSNTTPVDPITNILGIAGFSGGNAWALTIANGFSSTNVHQKVFESSGFRLEVNGLSLPNDGEWHHFIETFNKTSKAYRMCIDGTTNCTTTTLTNNNWSSDISAPILPQNPLGLGYPSYIGFGCDDLCHSPDDWSVDELAVWNNHILTDTEIDFLFNSGNGTRVLQAPPSVNTTGLEVYWKFEETSGILTTEDFVNIPDADSINDSGMTKSNTGVIGNAWRTADTGSAFVNITGTATDWDFMQSGSHSYNLWMQDPDPDTSDLGILFGTHNPTTASNGAQIDIVNNFNERMLYFIGKVPVGDILSSTFVDQYWDNTCRPNCTSFQMVTITVNETSGDLKWYKNGTLIQTDSAVFNEDPTQVPTAFTPKLFQRHVGSSFSVNKASFDEWSIWSRVLTPSEITTLFNGGQGLELQGAPVTVPNPPENATSTSRGYESVFLDWDHDGITVTNFTISRESPIGDGFSVIATTSDTYLETFTTEFLDTNNNLSLNGSTQYNYQICAVNGLEVETTCTTTVVTTPPESTTWQIREHDGGTGSVKMSASTNGFGSNDGIRLSSTTSQSQGRVAWYVWKTFNVTAEGIRDSDLIIHQDANRIGGTIDGFTNVQVCGNKFTGFNDTIWADNSAPICDNFIRSNGDRGQPAPYNNRLSFNWNAINEFVTVIIRYDNFGINTNYELDVKNVTWTNQTTYDFSGLTSTTLNYSDTNDLGAVSGLFECNLGVNAREVSSAESCDAGGFTSVKSSVANTEFILAETNEDWQYRELNSITGGNPQNAFIHFNNTADGFEILSRRNPTNSPVDGGQGFLFKVFNATDIVGKLIQVGWDGQLIVDGAGIDGEISVYNGTLFRWNGTQFRTNVPLASNSFIQEIDVSTRTAIPFASVLTNFTVANVPSETLVTLVIELDDSESSAGLADGVITIQNVTVNGLFHNFKNAVQQDEVGNNSGTPTPTTASLIFGSTADRGLVAPSQIIQPPVPDQVTGLTVIQNMTNNAELDWDDATGADNYQVFRGSEITWQVKEHNFHGSHLPSFSAFMDFGASVNNTLVVSTSGELTLHSQASLTNGHGFIYKSFQKSFIEGKDIVAEIQSYCSTGDVCTNLKPSMTVTDGSWEGNEATVFPDDSSRVELGKGTIGSIQDVAPTIPSAGITNITITASANNFTDTLSEVTIYIFQPDGTVGADAQTEIFRIIVGNSTTGQTIFNFSNPNTNYTSVRGLPSADDNQAGSVTFGEPVTLIGSPILSEFVDTTISPITNVLNYTVRGNNTQGFGLNSTITQFGLIQPIAGLTANATNSTTIKLSWDQASTVHPSDPLTGVIIQRSNATGFEIQEWELKEQDLYRGASPRHEPDYKVFYNVPFNGFPIHNFIDTRNSTEDLLVLHNGGNNVRQQRGDFYIFKVFDKVDLPTTGNITVTWGAYEQYNACGGVFPTPCASGGNVPTPPTIDIRDGSLDRFNVTDFPSNPSTVFGTGAGVPIKGSGIFSSVGGGNHQRFETVANGGAYIHSNTTSYDLSSSVLVQVTVALRTQDADTSFEPATVLESIEIEDFGIWNFERGSGTNGTGDGILNYTAQLQSDGLGLMDDGSIITQFTCTKPSGTCNSGDPVILQGSGELNFTTITTVDELDTMFNDTGLDENTSYVYRAKGESAVSTGAFDIIASATTPSVPVFNQTETDIVAVIDQEEFDITKLFTDVASVIDDVNATKIVGGVNFNQTETDIATVTDQEVFDITKLFSDTATTSDQDATTLNPIPDEINDLNAFAVADTCELTWSAPANLGDPFAPINGYKILRSIAGGSFNILVANTSSTLTAFNDTGLVVNADHDYDVRALNKHGEAVGSNIDTCLPQPTSPPNSPTLLIATAVGTNVQLDWIASTEGNPTGYFIERKIDGGGYIDLVLDTGSTSTTFIDNTVIPATKFFYRVSAINAFGVSAPSNEASVTTLETPNKPTLFAVQNVNQIDLTWTEPTSDEPINGYRVEKRINLGLFFDLVSNTTNTNLTLTDDNVTAGNTYGYRVRALSSIGTGAVSNVVDVNFGSHVIVEVREQDGTSYKGGGSVIMANTTFSTTQVINGLSNANFDNFEVGNYNFTFIDLDDFILNRTINFPFPSGNLTSTFEIRALVFDVDCPSNGGGTDVRIKVNYTNLHDISEFPSAPVCDSSDKVSWSTTWAGSEFSSNSTMIADFISVNFLSNADEFLVSTVPTGTSYDTVANRITSDMYGIVPQIPQTSQTINFDLFLGMSPPQGGGGGGGGGTPPFVPSITPRPEDLELTGLSLLSSTHQFAMAGDVIRGFIDIQWEGEDPLTITRITIGDFSGSMVFLDTPRFDIPQSIEGSGEFAMSSGSIAYVITLPPQVCQPEIGLDQNCLIKELFAIPVEFEFEFKGQTVTGSTNVMVDASEIPFDVVQLQVILLGIVLLGSALAGNFIRMRLKKQRKPANKKRRKFKKKFDSS